jgi:hypothetical protein
MDRIKYPRTFHFPWSDSNSSDDVWWKDTSPFAGRRIIMTEKMDGECASVYPDGHVHARSVDTDRHPSRTWVKRIAAEVAHEIPKGWRVCGENMYACHSIFYTHLPSYLLVYGIYDENNHCLPWDTVKSVCEMLGLSTVPVLYDGLWDEKLVRGLWAGKGTYPTYAQSNPDAVAPKFPEDFVPCEAEGYVVRLADSFPHADFARCCAKYVRENHVTTSTHWMERIPVPNLLASVH